MKKIIFFFTMLFFISKINAYQEPDTFYSSITTDNKNNLYAIQKNLKDKDKIIKINYNINSKEIWDLKNQDINDFEFLRIRTNSDNYIFILVKDKSRYFMLKFDEIGKLLEKWDFDFVEKSYNALFTIDEKDRIIFDNVLEDRKYTNKITILNKQGKAENHFLNNFKINGRMADIMSYNDNNIYIIYSGIDYVDLYVYTPQKEIKLGLATFSQEIVPYTKDKILARNPAWLEMYLKDGKKVDKLSWEPDKRIIGLAVDKKNNIFYTNINKIIQLQINQEEHYEVINQWD